MSLIARFTAALWAARTDLKIYHQQRSLTTCPTYVPATHICPLAQQPAAYPPSTPLLTRKRKKKKVRPAVAKKKKKMMMKMMRRVEKGVEAHAQQPNPRRPRPPVSPSQLWLLPKKKKNKTILGRSSIRSQTTMAMMRLGSQYLSRYHGDSHKLED